jgi:predicted Na+-dependent transporter
MNTDKPVAPWWTLPSLAVIVLAIFSGVIAASYATGQHDLSNTLSTGALNAMMLALGYFFGSSAGSAVKDKTIADNATALATSTPAPKQGS